MKLRDPVKQTIVLFAAKFPLVAGEAHCQEWTHKLCQQLAFSFPDDGWGHKGQPHSKDCIALESPFIGWDIILGAGTPSPVLNINGDSVDLAGQVFEEVMPINWLADAPPQPPTPPVVTDPCPCAAKLEAILAELRAQRAAVEQAGQDIRAEIAKGIKVRFS